MNTGEQTHKSFNAQPQAGATAPFALPRDVNVQYFPWKFEPGQHTVTAIPFAQGGGNGIAGKPVTLRLNVSK